LGIQKLTLQARTILSESQPLPQPSVAPLPTEPSPRSHVRLTVSRSHIDLPARAHTCRLALEPPLASYAARPVWCTDPMQAIAAQSDRHKTCTIHATPFHMPQSSLWDPTLVRSRPRLSAQAPSTGRTLSHRQAPSQGCSAAGFRIPAHSPPDSHEAISRGNFRFCVLTTKRVNSRSEDHAHTAGQPRGDFRAGFSIFSRKLQ
jgi:hypothetical protein